MTNIEKEIKILTDFLKGVRALKKKIKASVSIIIAFTVIFSSFLFAFAKGDYEGKLIILHTNDVHGAIDKYAYVAGIKKDFEAKGAEVVLTDSGDFMQGSNYVSISKGESAVSLMNLCGYDVVTIGNHEFDYGIDNLYEKFANADFAVTCANVSDAKGLLFDANYTYTASNGMKIGFFGLDTPESKTKVNPSLIKDISFSSGEALCEDAKKQVSALSGADIVICLSHLGVIEDSFSNSSYDISRNVSGIDFILDGHSHTVMTKGVSGEKIQSTGTKLEYAGVIVIDKDTKKIEKNYLIPIDENTPCDETVKQASDKYIAEIMRDYGPVFAKSNVELNGNKSPGNRTQETNLGDLIADSIRAAALEYDSSLKEIESKVIAITNGGGIREYIHKGDITKNDVNNVLPFGNTVSVVYITGSELLEVLEASTYNTPSPIGGFPQVSNISFTVDTRKKYDAKAETYPDSTYYGPASINRVKIKEIGGKPFDVNETYAVVTSNFCSAGGDTYYAFTNAKSQYDTGIAMDEALMDYIRDELGGTIGEKYAKPLGRITLKNGAFDFLIPVKEKISAWFIEVYNRFVKLFNTVKAYFAKL